MTQGSPFGILLSVVPQRGPIGTKFLFYAQNFKPSSRVKVKITDPNNHPIHDSELITDKTGNIGYGQLQLQATQAWVLGTYKFDVNGVSKETNQLEYHSMTFLLE